MRDAPVGNQANPVSPVIRLLHKRGCSTHEGFEEGWIGPFPGPWIGRRVEADDQVEAGDRLVAPRLQPARSCSRRPVDTPEAVARKIVAHAMGLGVVFEQPEQGLAVTPGVAWCQ